MMATDSQRSSTWSSWWLENRTQHPDRACSTSTRPMASIPLGSSPANGSSRTSRSGPCRRAAASCTRCWLPWESSSTLDWARSAMPRRSSHSSPARRASAGAMPWSRPRYSSCSPTCMAGYRPRSSGMYPKRRRSACPTGSPVPAHRPGVEVGEAEHGPHGGRLAGAVRAEEAHHLPARARRRSGRRAPSASRSFGAALRARAGRPPEDPTPRVLRLTGAGCRARPRASRCPPSSTSTPPCLPPR